jgi:hypothetical protein
LTRKASTAPHQDLTVDDITANYGYVDIESVQVNGMRASDGKPLLKYRLCGVAALALAGWYLMIPPSARDLDNSCKPNGPMGAEEMKRCDELELEVAIDAPLSKWEQVSEFETLAACHAQYDKDQGPPSDYGWVARTGAALELLDEGYRHPTEGQLSKRALGLSVAASAATLAEECIATDDPRLAK